MFTANKESKFTPNSATVGSEGLDIYAAWKIKDNFDIQYNGNEGNTNGIKMGNVFKGEDYTIPGTLPTRAGYSFIGWNTALNGSGDDYQPGATIQNVTKAMTEFLGYKRGKELQDLVANAYYVIVPSEWYENNPMTIIEAYSVGTPVIGARIGGIPEIVVESETGFQFESGNADNLRSKVILADGLTADEYTKQSAGALKFAHENLSLENYYPMLIAFYNQFLKK